MKIFRQILIHWLPFLFALFLCYTASSKLAAPDMRYWEPAFYSFLPMCFFFVAAVTFSMAREIRELRAAIAKLKPNEPAA